MLCTGNCEPDILSHFRALLGSIKGKALIKNLIYLVQNTPHTESINSIVWTSVFRCELLKATDLLPVFERHPAYREDSLSYRKTSRNRYFTVIFK